MHLHRKARSSRRLRKPPAPSSERAAPSHITSLSPVAPLTPMPRQAQRELHAHAVAGGRGHGPAPRADPPEGVPSSVAVFVSVRTPKRRAAPPSPTHGPPSALRQHLIFARFSRWCFRYALGRGFWCSELGSLVLLIPSPSPLLSNRARRQRGALGSDRAVTPVRRSGRLMGRAGAFAEESVDDLLESTRQEDPRRSPAFLSLLFAVSGLSNFTSPHSPAPPLPSTQPLFPAE